MRVAATTFKTLFGAPNFAQLAAEYAAEGKVEGLPDPQVKFGIYEGLEKAGRIHPFGAWDEDRLIGFVCVAVTPSTHYDQALCFAESYFVARDARSSGAGLALLRTAEAKARELCATGLLVSAPVGSRLAAMLPRLGYKDTSHTFFRWFDDA